VKNQTSVDIVIAFDPSLSDERINKQELTLVKQFLPELLKEMIWQTSEQEI
jgi:tRNA nucleotidyltransferase (CCA-adding enzyme)